jgi:DNA repair exonuclease SbcCD ATPase subunit
LPGKHIFYFQPGTLNIIESPNSGGKSSILKGLIAILSQPHSDKIDGLLEISALNFGIRGSSGNQMGIVNVHANQGSINLNIDGEEHRINVNQDGSLKKRINYGNSNFLLTGILSNKSKSVEDLKYDNDDLRWVVTDLSLARYYDQIFNVFEKRRIDMETRLNELNMKEDRINNSQKEYDEYESELVLLQKKLDEIYVNIEGDKELQETIRKLQKKQHDVTSQIKDLTRTVEEDRRNIQSYSTKMDLINRKKTNIIQKLDKIDLDEEKQLLHDMSDKNLRLIGDHKEARAGYNSEYNLLQVALTGLDSSSKKVTCPLCNDGKLDPSFIHGKLKELQKGIKSEESHIIKLNKEIDSQKKNVFYLTNELTKLKNELSIVKSEEGPLAIQMKMKDKIEEHMKKNNKMIDQLNNDINLWEKEVKDLTSKQLPESQKKQSKELENKINKIREEFGVLKDIMTDNTELIQGFDIEIEDALRIYSKSIDRISLLMESCSEFALEHRESARERFNEKVKEFLSQLGFKEFETLYLNKDYRLIIERKGKGGTKRQNIGSLSTSEIDSISLILQIALKETFTPDLPFFLIDDIMMDFDDDRKELVINYLSSYAATKGWYIISTRLNESIPDIRIIQA